MGANAENGSYKMDKNSATLTDCFIYIIGTFRVQNELMASFLHQKTGAKCLKADNVRNIPTIDDKNTESPRLILLDCLGKDPEDLLVKLESIDKKKIFSHDLVVLFNLSPGLRIEEEAVIRGVRGFFYTQDPLDRFQKGIRAVFNEELWLSREIMTKFILENKGRRRFSRTHTINLTRRESEILGMVATGTKNVEIASHLYISPHTVKTHLYNIYKKIKVSNRLEAAFWATKNL